MTPDSKKMTTKKVPAKKKVATKTVVRAKETPEKKAAKKTPASTRKAPAKKVAKKSTITAKPQSSSIQISSEERWKMIAVAAYHKAENRGFAPGGELQDWTEAEQEVDQLIMSS